MLAEDDPINLHSQRPATCDPHLFFYIMQRAIWAVVITGSLIGCAAAAILALRGSCAVTLEPNQTCGARSETAMLTHPGVAASRDDPRMERIRQRYNEIENYAKLTRSQPVKTGWIEADSVLLTIYTGVDGVAKITAREFIGTEGLEINLYYSGALPVFVQVTNQGKPLSWLYFDQGKVFRHVDQNGNEITEDSPLNQQFTTIAAELLNVAREQPRRGF